MSAYYNEKDPFAAAWLRELIRQNAIAPGDVDERSIEDVTPDDLDGYTQCHFFAGIGVWSYALRCAGWPDERPVWTGSCPCQPFSAAGKGGGFDDERHLWPAFDWLISQRRPGVVFGEQVASKDGLGWLDLVHADLEAAGYAFGAADLCAAGVGAPHIRQRIYFVADAGSGRLWRRHEHRGDTVTSSEVFGEIRQQRIRTDDSADGAVSELAHDDSARQRAHAGAGLHHEEHNAEPCSELGNTNSVQPEQSARQRARPGEAEGGWPCGELAGSGAAAGTMEQPSSLGRERGEAAGSRDQHDGAASERQQDQHGAGLTGSHWSDCDWLPCIDGKARPVEPGTFPLAHGAPARVGRLRGYGNAIVAPCAQAFIESYLDYELGLDLA